MPNSQLGWGGGGGGGGYKWVWDIAEASNEGWGGWGPGRGVLECAPPRDKEGRGGVFLLFTVKNKL
jgi:hypothetical protein